MTFLEKKSNLLDCSCIVFVKLMIIAVIKIVLLKVTTCYFVTFILTRNIYVKRFFLHKDDFLWKKEVYIVHVICYTCLQLVRK